MTEDEVNEMMVPCEVCGEPATRYTTSFPICNNPVCYEVRLEEMKEVVNQLNKKAKGGFG